jgi:hypothetical protein
MCILNSKRFVLTLAAALTVGAVIAASGPASAQKKMTYEQAFKACTAKIDKTVPKASDHSSDTQRTTAGAACMREYGFKLKNAAKF